jgi:hypothetical protein
MRRAGVEELSAAGLPQPVAAALHAHLAADGSGA